MESINPEELPSEAKLKKMLKMKREHKKSKPKRALTEWQKFMKQYWAKYKQKYGAYTDAVKEASQLYHELGGGS